MTLPRYRAIYARFRINPPTHWLVAAILGWKPSDGEPGSEKPDSIDVRDLFDMVGGGAVTMAHLTMLM